MIHRIAIVCLSVLCLWHCSSQLEKPLTNVLACKQLKESIDRVCTGDEAIGWLNCDFLPGCPGGKVEEESIRVCSNQIAVSPTCQSAREVDCSVVKLDCGAPSEKFVRPVGFNDACTKIFMGLQTYSDDLCGNLQAISDCSRFLGGCSAGVFEDDDVEACVSLLKKSPDCNAAITTAETCEIKQKYCLP